MSVANKVTQAASTYADQAAGTADSAIKSTQRVANDTLDSVSDAVNSLHEQVSPVISKLASQAEVLARRGLEAVRDSSKQAQERAMRVSDTTVSYIRDEPVRSILIAAATGAALMALVSLMGRSRDNG